MRVTDFNISADVSRLLSAAQITAAIEQFHPVGECAVCRRPLGSTGRFSVLTEDAGMTVILRPAHAPCVSSTAIVLDHTRVSADNYQALPIVWPIEHSMHREPVPQPVVLVTPSTDQVTYIRTNASTGEPRLVDGTDYFFAASAWIPLRSASEQMVAPVGTVKTSGGERVVLESELGTWDVEVPDGFFDAMATYWGGGAFVGVMRRRPVTDVYAATDPLSVLDDRMDAGDLWTGYFARS